MSAPAPLDLSRTDPFTPRQVRLAVVSGGLGDPSQTRALADALAEATSDALSAAGVVPQVETVDLRVLAVEIAQAMVTPVRSARLEAALRTVQEADALVAVTPTFKASYSGLFKSFVDLIEDGSLSGVPTLLGATGGTARHSLVVDTALRPLFAYLRALVVPASVFAASDDWGRAAGQPDSTWDVPLRSRIEAAGRQLADVVLGRPSRADGSEGPAGPVPATQAPRTADGGRAADAYPALEVTPFEQLLHPGR